MMAEHDMLRRLRRMQRIASGMLVCMALLLVLARAMDGRHGAWQYIAAFAEAAMVGGLADWFAVTALFRHPLGVPLPHTAIIPSNKDRLGASFRAFLEQNFLTREVVRAELARVDFSAAAANWLQSPANRHSLVNLVRDAAPRVVGLLEDNAAQALLRDSLGAALRGVRLAPLLSDLLGVLVQGRQHHVLLERLLGIVARALERNRPFIRQKVHENSPRWVPRAVDDKLYERLMEGVHLTLLEIQSEDSEWRDRFQAASEELISKLATSAEYEEKLQRLLHDWTAHPLFHDYAGRLWRALRQRLLDDAQAADSQIVARLDDALVAFGDGLRRNPAVQAWLNQWLRDIACENIVARRHAIAGTAQRVIGAWDGATVARRVELYLGRDLQFIRINGTLVGGCVGVALHASGALF